MILRHFIGSIFLPILSVLPVLKYSNLSLNIIVHEDRRKKRGK